MSEILVISEHYQKALLSEVSILSILKTRACDKLHLLRGGSSCFFDDKGKILFPRGGKIDSQYLATNEKIADELADILYAIIKIARHYNIDLLEAHIKARQSEDAFLNSKGV